MFDCDQPLFEAVRQRLRTNPRVLVAIDGQAAAGKSTLGAALTGALGGNLLHMDDFFLPPSLRTPERLSQIGGNVEYERFLSEVLRPLLAGSAFAYRPFDCQTGTLKAPVAVRPAPLTVIEGAYSRHPAFGDPYDLRVCLLIEPALQRARIERRNPQMAQRFFERWIPLENRYLSACGVPESSDFVLTASD